MRNLMLALALSAAFPNIAPAAGTPPSIASVQQSIIDIVKQHPLCLRHDWHARGLAPQSYIKGVAVTYARVVCHPESSATQVVSTHMDAVNHPNDALVVYKDLFAAKGMKNDADGRDTLRHSYTLLIGLGMMESSGKYCEGRDVSQCFTSADTAEAGLFQTSFGAHTHSKALDDLFSAYTKDQSGCMLDVYQGSISCKISKSHNPKCPNDTSDVAGTGKGADWQRLTKSCPAFATEYGAVVLRTNGGKKGEFNPIRKRQAELLPACDSMLADVETAIGKNPDFCKALK